MRTEDDVRAALRTREALAPDPASVLLNHSATSLAPRRRTSSLAAAALACVAAAAVAVPVGVRLFAAHPAPNRLPGKAPVAGSPRVSRPSPPTGTRPPFSFTLIKSSVDSYQIVPQAVGPNMQVADIWNAGDPHSGVTLYVYDLNSTERAGWDLSRNPKRVTVAGTTGWFTTSGAATALRWAYRPGGWAVILSGHGGVAGPPLPEQTLIRLAEAVRFTVAYPVILPYRLSHLPADLHPFNVVQAPGSSPASVLQLSSAPERSDHTRIVDITVTAGAPAAGWQPSTRIAGRPARCTTFIDGRRCVVDFGTATVDIGQGSLSDGELAGIVAGVHLADVGSPRTWYALATALPGR